MRVAFSGTHRTGKTTLIEALSEQLPSYQIIEEPYRSLEDEGYEFSDPPVAEDFECQLQRSIESIARAPRDCLIDRTPLDFVAYLRALDGDFAIGDWLPRVREVMGEIDLVVVLPIEAPERIALPAHEDRHLRSSVDALIQAIVLDDEYGFEVAAIEVLGDLAQRVRQVLRSVR